MDERRKKLRLRAWRRGFREIDLIMGGYADRRLAAMDDSALDDFERLLDANDQDVYAWIVGAAIAPPAFDTPTLSALQRFRISDEAP